jgi:tRNA-specific 2-thiouridylase
MPPEALAEVRFPLGGLAKDEVRARAAAFALPNAAKPESQEICFVPDGDHAGFVARAALARGRAPRPGPIVDEAGAVVGDHDGIHRFTIGQRKGLGVATGAPRYVRAIDPASGAVHLAPRDACAKPALRVGAVRWLGAPVEGEADALVQLRHRGRPVPARLRRTGVDEIEVALGEPTIAAPGQAAVFYAGDAVLGGGWVART